MEQDLRKTLEKYRTFTLQLIDSVEKENYDVLQPLLDKRQSTIDIMCSMEYTKEEFSLIAEEFEILMLQKKLLDLMNEKRKKVKYELSKISESRTARKGYNKKFYIDSMFFNKKI